MSAAKKRGGWSPAAKQAQAAVVLGFTVAAIGQQALRAKGAAAPAEGPRHPHRWTATPRRRMPWRRK